MRVRHNSWLLVIAIILIAVGGSLFYAGFSRVKVAGNAEFQKEIDSLLIPVYERSITEGDFDKLKRIAKNDCAFRDEVWR